MKFYFPDSQDLVSPAYDFVRDEYPPHRVRQRDDRYAHEVLSQAPYHGILVSKSIVDGSIELIGASVSDTFRTNKSYGREPSEYSGKAWEISSQVVPSSSLRKMRRLVAEPPET